MPIYLNIAILGTIIILSISAILEIVSRKAEGAFI